MTNLELFDILFSLRLEQWTFLRKGLHDLFNAHEFDTLQRSERAFRSGGRQVVLLAFENRFASLGGLTPVMKHLTAQLRKMGERVIFISPFHAGHSAMRNALKAGLFKPCFEQTTFHLCNYEASVSCLLDTTAEIPSYYLQVPGRFTAGENPYAYKNQEDLLLDALAFCSAVPFALGKLGITENLLFHAHEWETAPIAITSRMAAMSSVVRQARTVLTLHNSFDSGFPPSVKRIFFGAEIAGDTVLQCSIPFLNSPLVTVSTPFAVEVCHDPLQRTVFTDHLQTQFSMNPPVGIENGIFSNSGTPFSPAILAGASSGRFEKLMTRKDTFKRRFIKVLDRIRDHRIAGKLAIDPADSRTPIFFMAGRLDFMQKGFDIMFHAFERLNRGAAKLFFCPSSSTGPMPDGLKFFKELARRCPGDIEIWPFKIPRRLYDLFLRGSSFLLMPSLYEPFGSANEGLVSGTPVVARGTGGLWLQVNSACPVEVPSFYGNLQLNGNQERPTGILFRERYPDEDAEHEWRGLLDRAPEKRTGVPLYGSLVESAHEALEKAIELYGRQEEYARLILNGVDEVRNFSWERAARKYQQVYDVATNRGM